MRIPLPRRAVLSTTFLVFVVIFRLPDRASAAGPSASVCPPRTPSDQLLALFPYLWLIVVAGLLIGLMSAWLSRQAGDNAWESARQGMATGLAAVGPLLTVLGLLAVLPAGC